MWVTPAGQGLDVLWAQEFYNIPDFVIPGALVTADAPPLPTYADDVYYNPWSTVMSLGNPFALLTSFADDVARFQALSDDQQRRFLQASQWMTAANDISDRHSASWYIAMVAAVESLAHEAHDADDCPTCGRDRNQRPTASFKDFLERFAPGSGSRTQTDRLYSVRSALVHGTALLHHDSPFGSSLFAWATDERANMDCLSSAVNVAMVNWLRNPTGAAATAPVLPA